MTSKRNSSIDIFRLVAAALVVVQHYGIIYPRTTKIAMVTDLFSRIAVPFFFMVSGFFSWKDDPILRRGYLKKQALTIGKILIVSSVILMVANIFLDFHIRITAKSILYLLIYNEPRFLFGHSHMWYMLALIYVLLIAIVIDKLGKNKAAYAAAPLILAAAIGLDIYLRAQGTMRSCFVRNFFLFGLPYFYIGQFLHRYQDKILDKINKPRSIALFFICAAGLTAEAFLALKFDLASFGYFLDRKIFLFLPPLGFSVFLLLLHYPNIGQNSFAARYARDASMIIYIIHHFVEDLINTVAANVWGIEMFRHATARFFLIMFLSSIVGFGYAVAVKKLRRNVDR